MTRSEEYYKKALQLIPWGTQTNAKRPIEDYAGVMPFYIERGKGCRLWDVDGNEFIDYRLSLGPVILGYCDREVDEAVLMQMQKGVLFSMASPIELELAELVHECVENAEMVRFMKTGEDANSCAVRIARAWTGRDMIVTCGYHGYPDWFATGAGLRGGVPTFMRDFVRVLSWGDLEQAETIIRQFGDKIACVLTIPYDFGENTSGEFLRFLRKITQEFGILLIFDEVLTGFRLALGGAQEFFGVKADLISFAKAIANGYPLSCFTGKKVFMQKLDDFVITTTYAGETLSIAAAIATLSIMKRDHVHKHIWDMGRRLMRGLDSIAEELGIEAKALGLPPGSYVEFQTSSEALNRRLDFVFKRELYGEGVFANVLWFISYAHKENDIDETLEKSRKAMRRTLEIIVKGK
jgi:glutamate-1-semialdehyde aminotransferase